MPDKALPPQGMAGEEENAFLVIEELPTPHLHVSPLCQTAQDLIPDTGIQGQVQGCWRRIQIESVQGEKELLLGRFIQLFVLLMLLVKMTKLNSV